MEGLISFVIANWNHKVLLVECLQSILMSDDNFNKEIVVVDNASTDGSQSYVKNLFGNEIKWVQNKKNEGYAKAVNKGVALSKGNLVFLLNNDVKLHVNTVRFLVHFMEVRALAGAVAPLLYYPTGELQISCRRFPTPFALFFENFGIGNFGPFRRWKLASREHVKGGVVLQPMASVLLVKRKCWYDVGVLDEDFPIFFNDVDWCYRLYRDTRYKIYLCNWARAVHHEGASVNRLGVRKKVEFYKGLYRFYKKHYLT